MISWFELTGFGQTVFFRWCLLHDILGKREYFFLKALKLDLLASFHLSPILYTCLCPEPAFECLQLAALEQCWGGVHCSGFLAQITRCESALSGQHEIHQGNVLIVNLKKTAKYTWDMVQVILKMKKIFLQSYYFKRISSRRRKPLSKMPNPKFKEYLKLVSSRWVLNGSL